MELDMIQRMVSLRPEIVESPLEDARAPRRGDFPSAVRAMRIQHHHIVTPRQRIETGPDIGLLVLGQDQNRKHLVDDAASADV
jgi:hypothetical protein